MLVIAAACVICKYHENVVEKALSIHSIFIKYLFIKVKKG